MSPNEFSHSFAESVGPTAHLPSTRFQTWSDKRLRWKSGIPGLLGTPWDIHELIYSTSRHGNPLQSQIVKGMVKDDPNFTKEIEIGQEFYFFLVLGIPSLVKRDRCNLDVQRGPVYFSFKKVNPKKGMDMSNISSLETSDLHPFFDMSWNFSMTIAWYVYCNWIGTAINLSSFKGWFHRADPIRSIWPRRLLRSSK